MIRLPLGIGRVPKMIRPPQKTRSRRWSLPLPIERVARKLGIRRLMNHSQDSRPRHLRKVWLHLIVVRKIHDMIPTMSHEAQARE